MDEENKEQLKFELALEKFKELHPEEVKDLDGKDGDGEKLKSLLNNYSDEFLGLLQNIKPEEIDNLEAQYLAAERESRQEEMTVAAKGAKLKKLKEMKGSAKKCKCGCDLITVREKGGKLTTKCACNCSGGKATKNEKGGILNFLKKGGVVSKQTGGDIERPAGSVEKKGGKLLTKGEKKETGNKFKNRVAKAKLKK